MSIIRRVLCMAFVVLVGSSALYAADSITLDVSPVAGLKGTISFSTFTIATDLSPEDNAYDAFEVIIFPDWNNRIAHPEYSIVFSWGDSGWFTLNDPAYQSGSHAYTAPGTYYVRARWEHALAGQTDYFTYSDYIMVTIDDSWAIITNGAGLSNGATLH